VALPQFFLIGAPKAGTSALHAALAQHPQLYLSPVKEPKFFLCDGAPPAPEGQRGPGDAHSAKEWVWRRDRYEDLFSAAPAGALRGESTPFYLYDRAAHRRIAERVPDARLVAIIRDPVDRAYSNWMHLWSDGLEPVSDFAEAWALEDERVAAGYAPFWHYRRLGLYGEQLADLRSVFDPAQIHVLRYRDLVDEPETSLGRIAEFLGVEPVPLAPPAPENVKPFVAGSVRNRALAQIVRAGAGAGASVPPKVWRQASRPLLSILHSGGATRPLLDPELRLELVASFADDIALLQTVTGESYQDWMHHEGRGSFTERRSSRRDDDDELVAATS
jgi:hypothetical protein